MFHVANGRADILRSDPQNLFQDVNAAFVRLMMKQHGYVIDGHDSFEKKKKQRFSSLSLINHTVSLPSFLPKTRVRLFSTVSTLVEDSNSDGRTFLGTS